jgi:hypothetical protein
VGKLCSDVFDQGCGIIGLRMTHDHALYCALFWLDRANHGDDEDIEAWEM